MAALHSAYMERITRERNGAIEKAVKAVEDIIEQPGRSREEIYYLTAMVADRLEEKVFALLEKAMLEKDESLAYE